MTPATIESWPQRAYRLVERERLDIDQRADVLLNFVCDIRSGLPAGAVVADIILTAIIDALLPHIGDRGGAGPSYAQTLAVCGRWLIAAQQIMEEEHGRHIPA